MVEETLLQGVRSGKRAEAGTRGEVSVPGQSQDGRAGQRRVFPAREGECRGWSERGGCSD